MGRIKILVVEPLKVPKTVEIEHNLEEMRRIVGGAIACTYPWDDLVGLVHADDGIALGYPLNRSLETEDGKVYDIVPGTFFLCGLSTDDFASIPDDMAEKYMKLFLYPEFFMRTLDGKLLRFKIGSGEPPKEIW
ncbi:MAG: DUF3846 domain-containing protein [Blautia sp.]|nr:DUF3846 domain-containing protein [Blautia sp.]